MNIGVPGWWSGLLCRSARNLCLFFPHHFSLRNQGQRWKMPTMITDFGGSPANIYRNQWYIRNIIIPRSQAPPLHTTFTCSIRQKAVEEPGNKATDK